MSGEDPWDPGPVVWNFRYRCNVCGKQRQVDNGQYVQPDCGHDEDAIRVEMGDE